EVDLRVANEADWRGFAVHRNRHVIQLNRQLGSGDLPACSNGRKSGSHDRYPFIRRYRAREKTGRALNSTDRERRRRLNTSEQSMRFDRIVVRTAADAGREIQRARVFVARPAAKMQRPEAGYRYWIAFRIA